MKIKEALSVKNLDRITKDRFEELYRDLTSNVVRYLKKQRGIGIHAIYDVYSGTRPPQDVLSEQNYPQFFELFSDKERDQTGQWFTDKKVAKMVGTRTLTEYVLDRLLTYFPNEITDSSGKPVSKTAIRRRLAGYQKIPRIKERILQRLNREFTLEKVQSFLRENRNFRRVMRRIDNAEAYYRTFRDAMVTTIPDNPIDLYPLARKMKRRFILHIGPTNSGKTYEAMQALRKAGNGLYLAPLRLLAYEQYETMNGDGYPCSMVTGEERIEIPDAVYQASTIEMADLSNHYEAAVIDEGQMVSDPERGGSWTSAILGLLADTIHICAAPEAEALLIRLIEECGDIFEIVTHHRRTELLIDKREFRFPNDLEDGDAVIAFSRANVHAVASEIRRHGKESSVIYGALPYDVRHEEAARFSKGETKIVVATDAIGMGLNLPIRRIVFLEGSKFDGRTRRTLLPHEVKQIAGRAGRYGIYDVGYVTAEEEVKSIIMDGLYRENEPLTRAVLGFPESLLGIDVPLSESMERWVNWETGEMYEKEDLKQELMLTRMIESRSDNKELIYELVSIPFDAGNRKVLNIWYDMARSELSGIGYQTDDELEYARDNHSTANMEEAEELYKICDLLYYYNEKFGYDAKNAEILETKRLISLRIIDLLEEHKLEERRCKCCGKALRWNHPYPTCQTCYRTGRAFRIMPETHRTGRNR